MKISILTRDSVRLVDLNRRRAIRERCLNCSCWSFKDVQDCPFPDCPIFLFRTGKGKQAAKERDEAIKSYCRWCANGSAKEVMKCPTESCPLWSFRNSRVVKKSSYTGTEKNEKPAAIGNLKPMRHKEKIKISDPYDWKPVACNRAGLCIIRRVVLPRSTFRMMHFKKRGNKNVKTKTKVTARHLGGT